MAGNKTAIARYRVIDQCLRNPSKRIWTQQALLDACADATGTRVTGSMFEKDINHLRYDRGLGFYAPIIYDEDSAGYKYENPFYRLSFDPGEYNEFAELTNAITILRDILDSTQLPELYHDMRELFLRFQSKAEDIPALELESSPYPAAAQWVKTLRKYVKEKCTASIYYKPFQMDARHIIVSPLLVKRYNQRWFLFAVEHVVNKIHVFGLERIVSIKDSLFPFKKVDFKPEDYFKDIVGVTKPEGVEKTLITFETTPLQAEYIRTKPFHNSLTEIKSTKRFVRFSIACIPNYELETKFLSFGENVKIISPAKFKNRLKRRLSKALKQYN